MKKLEQDISPHFSAVVYKLVTDRYCKPKQRETSLKKKTFFFPQETRKTQRSKKKNPSKNYKLYAYAMLDMIANSPKH